MFVRVDKKKQVITQKTQNHKNKTQKQKKTFKKMEQENNNFSWISSIYGCRYADDLKERDVASFDSKGLSILHAAIHTRNRFVFDEIMKNKDVVDKLLCAPTRKEFHLDLIGEIDFFTPIQFAVATNDVYMTEKLFEASPSLRAMNWDETRNGTHLLDIANDLYGPESDIKKVVHVHMIAERERFETLSTSHVHWKKNLMSFAPDVIRRMMQGKNMNILDKQGMAYIHYAIEMEKPEKLEALLDLGADIELPTRSGLKPLMIAAQYAFPQTLKVLVKRGANKNVTYEGKTLQELCDPSVLEILNQ